MHVSGVGSGPQQLSARQVALLDTLLPAWDGLWAAFLAACAMHVRITGWLPGDTERGYSDAERAELAAGLRAADDPELALGALADRRRVTQGRPRNSPRGPDDEERKRVLRNQVRSRAKRALRVSAAWRVRARAQGTPVATPASATPLSNAATTASHCRLTCFANSSARLRDGCACSERPGATACFQLCGCAPACARHSMHAVHAC
jgi:hypothetical protein